MVNVFNHELEYYPCTRRGQPVSLEIHFSSVCIYCPCVFHHLPIVIILLLLYSGYCTDAIVQHRAMHGSLKLSPDRCIMHSLRSLFSASRLTFSNPFPYFTSQQTFTYTIVLGIRVLYNVTHNCTCSIIAMYVHIYIHVCI